jgi:centromere protein C
LGFRKTGVTLRDTGVRDEHGMEPIDNIFSSPAKGNSDDGDEEEEDDEEEGEEADDDDDDDDENGEAPMDLTTGKETTVGIIQTTSLSDGPRTDTVLLV